MTKKALYANIIFAAIFFVVGIVAIIEHEIIAAIFVFGFMLVTIALAKSEWKWIKQERKKGMKE